VVLDLKRAIALAANLLETSMFATLALGRATLRFGRLTLPRRWHCRRKVRRRAIFADI
jgi:hypothetical protein